MERQKEERVFVKTENNSFHPWMHRVSYNPRVRATVYTFNK